jgi:hypothetical protein
MKKKIFEPTNGESDGSGGKCHVSAMSDGTSDGEPHGFHMGTKDELNK